MIRKTIVINGGLGNQLFQFSFAHYLVKKLNAPIELYAPNKKYGSREFKLQSLCTKCTHVEFVNTERSWKIDTFFRFHDFLNLRFDGRFNRVFEKYLQIEKNAYVVEDIRPYTWLHSGYFQNWHYVAETLSLIAPELDNMLADIQILGFPHFDGNEYGVIHYRRGDLLNFRLSMGLLDDDYFLKAIDFALAGLNPAIKLVVLTDDKRAGEEAFSGITKDVFGPSEMEEWEALKMMSKAKFVITSNSTFSWWGALLCAQNGGDVYIPSPWFLNWNPVPGDAFVFPNFKVVPSKFS